MKEHPNFKAIPTQGITTGTKLTYVGDQILLAPGLSLLGKVARSAGFFHNWDAPLFYPQGITPNTQVKITN